MRKAILMLAAFVVVAGCTSHKVDVGNGSTVTTNGVGSDQTVTVQGNGKTVTEGKNAVAPSTIGLPVYPGASATQGGSMSATSRQGSGAVIVLKTSDPFDKVYSWYKLKMPAGSQQMETTAGTTSEAEFTIGATSDKQQKTVLITSGSDGTSIMLTAATKNH